MGLSHLGTWELRASRRHFPFSHASLPNCQWVLLAADPEGQFAPITMVVWSESQSHLHWVIAIATQPVHLCSLERGKLWWWDKSCPSLVSLNGFVGTEPHPSRLDVCGWLCPTAADLSRCNTDHMASKAENTYYLAFLQKRLAYLYSVLLRKEYHFIEKERERK